MVYYGRVAVPEHIPTLKLGAGVGRKVTTLVDGGLKGMHARLGETWVALLQGHCATHPRFEVQASNWDT